MAQLPLPEFHTEAGRKELDQLLAGSKSNSDSFQSAPTIPAFAAANENFLRSIITSPSEALGNYVFGSGYAPFDAPNPSYRAPGKHIAIAIELSRPLSRDSVHITSSLPEHTGTNAGIAINSRYLSHLLDIEILSCQLRFTEDMISRAESLTRYLNPFSKRFADLHIAKEHVRRTVDGAYHYTGTFAMMSREMGGVVNSRLRAYGCSNLRVFDASVIPVEPTANPQAVVYAVAEIGAGFVKEEGV
ncbi:hypothetical protein EAF00_005589 [Botryotinia globosa]|nr:hypothetical protein EAF00_005589 [Botryotinia globosa]